MPAARDRLTTCTLGELARLVDGTLHFPDGPAADGYVAKNPNSASQPPEAMQITGLAALGDAEPGELAHLSSTAYASALPDTRASAVLLRETDLINCPVAAIIVANPYWAYARISQRFERPQALGAGIAATATIDPSAVLGADVVVGAGARVGARSQLLAGCVVHANAVIGADCRLDTGVCIHAGAVLADTVSIGANSTVHANAVIGSEGFGYAPDSKGELERIAQLGGVELGKNVSVGAGSTIDRGALGNTSIGDGVKIDNQVQIGHNCVIGNHSVICGCCGIVGSTTIGAHCVLGGAVGVGGDGPISICDGVTVSGMTHVSRSIDAPGVYSGGVLHDKSQRWKRNALRFADLDGLAKRLAALEKRFRNQ